MASKKRPVLDLHGLTTDEVFNRLDQFIMQNKNQEELLIIVGKGKGLLRKKTIEYLKGGHYPYRYEKIRGLDNPGALIVDLS